MQKARRPCSTTASFNSPPPSARLRMTTNILCIISKFPHCKIESNRSLNFSFLIICLAISGSWVDMAKPPAAARAHSKLSSKSEARASHRRQLSNFRRCFNISSCGTKFTMFSVAAFFTIAWSENIAKCKVEIPCSAMILAFASSPEAARFVSASNASNFSRSFESISRTREINGLMEPIFWDEVSRLGFVLISILPMVCRSNRRIFFFVSEGIFSSFSILIKELRTPCWIIVPRTESMLAMRLRAKTICSSVFSLAPCVSWTSARGTFAATICWIRFSHCSSESSV